MGKSQERYAISPTARDLCVRVEPARPYRTPGFEGRVYLTFATSADATTVKFSTFQRDNSIRLSRRCAHGPAGCGDVSMLLRATLNVDPNLSRNALQCNKIKCNKLQECQATFLAGRTAKLKYL